MSAKSERPKFKMEFVSHLQVTVCHHLGGAGCTYDHKQKRFLNGERFDDAEAVAWLAGELGVENPFRRVAS